MEKPLVITIGLITLVSIAIPVMLYLTYPVEEGDIVEHIVEKVYGNPSKQIPKFVPGVFGYISPTNRGFRCRGMLILKDKEFNFIITDRGERLLIMFLSEYRCVEDGIFTILHSETIMKNFSNKSISLVGYFFRTPRGPIIVPIEVNFDGIRCAYLRR
ncbi:MAG: hypothetical protein QXL96_06835 [Ignisphaera sp.]